MKAVQIYEHGGTDKLRYEDAPDPVPRSPRDAVVRLRAASLNHIDLWNRKGLTGMKVEFPHILGADGAGVVEEVGSEVTHTARRATPSASILRWGAAPATSAARTGTSCACACAFSARA